MFEILLWLNAGISLGVVFLGCILLGYGVYLILTGDKK